jgi:hypothetical protein
VCGATLEQLDAVARLEIAGLFLEDDVLHLVGRTSGLPRRHYYRRRAGASGGRGSRSRRTSTPRR